MEDQLESHGQVGISEAVMRHIYENYCYKDDIKGFRTYLQNAYKSAYCSMTLKGLKRITITKTNLDSFLAVAATTLKDTYTDTFDELEKKYLQIRSENYSTELRKRIEELRRIYKNDEESQKDYALKVLAMLINPVKRTVKLEPDKIIRTLNRSHYGMDRVKKKIIGKITSSYRSHNKVRPLLLVGPAGTGKTSLTRSVSMAAGIPFSKISMNGITVAEELSKS